MYPSPDKLDWMFPMDYSTKSFDNILSSLWTSDDYLGKNENYHFEMRTSTDNPEETYIAVSYTHLDVYKRQVLRLLKTLLKLLRSRYRQSLMRDKEELMQH